VQYVTDLLLNIKEPFIYQVAVLADQMGEVFPEIRKQQGLVTNVIREEETSFAYTGSRVSC
jgi:alanyl-tRNA synthetase